MNFLYSLFGYKQNTENKDISINSTVKLQDLLKDCDTGDIILFDGYGVFPEIIKEATNSCWTHVGIIIKNPDYIKGHEKGIYLYNADGSFEKDIETDTNIVGIQLVDLEKKLLNYKGEIYYRKLITNISKAEINSVLKFIHIAEYHKYYDWLPYDWLGAFLALHKYNRLSKFFANPQHLDKMFCSALVAYIYTELELLPKNTEWSFIPPSYFAEINNFEDGSSLDIIKKVEINI